jgi:hypothetical protein
MNVRKLEAVVQKSTVNGRKVPFAAVNAAISGNMHA